MRGKDEQQLDVFSYVSPEQRVPQDHPLRSLRVMTDEALRELQPRFNRLYATIQTRTRAAAGHDRVTLPKSDRAPRHHLYRLQWSIARYCTRRVRLSCGEYRLSHSVVADGARRLDHSHR